MKTNNRDPAIDEVRETRRRISAEVGHDPARLVERYQQMEKQYQDRMLKSRTDQSPEAEPAA